MPENIAMLLCARAYTLRFDYSWEELCADVSVHKAPQSDWWQYLPVAMKSAWLSSSEDTRIAVAVMGMGLAVGAIQGYKTEKSDAKTLVLSYGDPVKCPNCGGRLVGKLVSDLQCGTEAQYKCEQCESKYTRSVANGEKGT